MTDPLVATARLLSLMQRLRDPKSGCPWDLAQDYASIAPHTIEESYEVAEAIANEDLAGLQDELGDLLFQVVFLAQLAAEQQAFDFGAVAEAIADKLVRRHPHVFAGDAADPAELSGRWEAHKVAERAARGQSRTLAGVAVALPALTRATKLGRRAAGVGFDWSNAAGVRAKVLEELRELDDADAGGDQSARSEEMGDLLFSIANLARHYQVDAEQALRAANRKFERRFARMEDLARERGWPLPGLDAQRWDELWNLAKGSAGGAESS